MSGVHWVQSGAKAKIENDGHGDTCGPIVGQDYMALHSGMVLDNATLDALRQRLINDKLMDLPGDPGMTINEVATMFEKYWNVTPVKVVPFNAGLNFAQFRDDLIVALEAHQLVIMETGNAQALPDNQPGVQYHFLLFVGIDSNLGYYTCNGDTETGLRSGNETTDPVWYGIGSLQAAKPVGYIILPAIEVPNPVTLIIEKNDQGQVTGAHDADNPALHIGAGFAYAAEQSNLLDTSITTVESYQETLNAGNVGYCVLSHRYLGTWTPSSGIHLNDWTEAAELLEALAHEAHNPPAPADADTLVNVDLSAVRADINQLDKDLAALEQAQGADK